MSALFYINAGVAVVATLLVVISEQAVHALLYFIASLLSVAVTLYMLGAHFAAALEVIIYAGAIMVLFVFVVMLLGAESKTPARGTPWKNWALPLVFSAILIFEFIFLTLGTESPSIPAVGLNEVAKSLFTTYALGIELASFVLLAGLVAAYHIGKKRDAHGSN